MRIFKRIALTLLVIAMAFAVYINITPRIKSAGIKTEERTPAAAETAAPTATPAPAPTPEPTPEPTPKPVPPDFVDADGNFYLYGRAFNVNDEKIDLCHANVDDNAYALELVLPCMENLKTLDMDSCGVGDERMVELRDSYPDVEVIWRINFGNNYTARTNIVKLLASMPSKGGKLTDAVGEKLKYLTNLHYLDLGHNDELSDFSFVEYMPKLEIVVCSDTAISDLTPFTKCPNLQYIEAGHCNISDLSPLKDCTNLLHLNVGTNAGVSDISPLYGLNLLRLWLGSYDPVPAEQVAKMQELHPDCIIDTTCPSGLERKADGSAANEGFVMNGWKDYMQWMLKDWEYAAMYGVMPAATPKGYYKGIYTAFEYNLAGGAYAFTWNDPLYEWDNTAAEPVNMTIVDWKAIGEKSLIEDDWTWEEKYGSGVEKSNEQILAERAEKAAAAAAAQAGS